VLSSLRSSDIIFIQESLLLAPTKLFPGFVLFDVPAVVTGRRNSGGLCILVRRSSFRGTTFEPLIHESRILVVLLKWAKSSLLLCNIYTPNGTAHADFFVTLYARLQAVLETVVPAAVVLAGDFNAHLHSPRSPRDRDFQDFHYRVTTDGLVSFPVEEQPFTFISGPTSSTIDYVFHRGLGNVSCKVLEDVSVAQHKPLLVNFEFAVAAASAALQTAPGAAYWRSACKEKNFPESLAHLPPAYEQTTRTALQGYYEKFSNLRTLACKKPTKARSPGGWSSKLTAYNAKQLNDLCEEV
jgi:hypothetical protein